MDSNNLFTLIMAIITIVGTLVGTWAITRRNQSEISKAKALSAVRAQDAETQERADLIAMLKESGKNSVTWLESLKVIEHTRELDYATLKAIIEDGTKETINSRKEMLAKLGEMSKLDETHNTGITKSLDEVKHELAAMRVVVDTLPGENQQIKKHLNELLGYIDRLLPKLTRQTSEFATTPAPNGTPDPSPSPS